MPAHANLAAKMITFSIYCSDPSGPSFKVCLSKWKSSLIQRVKVGWYNQLTNIFHNSRSVNKDQLYGFISLELRNGVDGKYRLSKWSESALFPLLLLSYSCLCFMSLICHLVPLHQSDCKNYRNAYMSTVQTDGYICSSSTI